MKALQLFNKFQALHCREKVLATIFVWLLCFTWFSSCIKRSNVFTQNWKITKNKIKGYQYWVKNQDIIQTNLNNILKWIEFEKTYSGPQLAGHAERIARENQLTYSMTSPKTRHGDIFDAHTLQLHCENASLEKLISFEKVIHAMKPYIGLEKVKIHANNFNPTLLEVDFDLTALQLQKIIQ